MLDQGKFSRGQPAFLHTSVGRPSQLELRVESSPSVTASTAYSVACGVNEDNSFNRQGPSGQTPVTGPLLIPDGPPGGCYINISARSSKPAQLTVTLLTLSSSGA